MAEEPKVAVSIVETPSMISENLSDVSEKVSEENISTESTSGSVTAIPTRALPDETVLPQTEILTQKPKKKKKKKKPNNQTDQKNL